MSGPADWYTPRWLLDLATEALGGIGLDPCADAGKRVPAEKHFTLEDDGLNLAWCASTVFVNPPYAAGEIQLWVSRFTDEYFNGCYARGLLLIPNATETRWFARMWRECDAVVFLTGRVAFDAGVGQHVSSNKRGNALAYCGDRARRRLAVFERHGMVVLR